VIRPAVESGIRPKTWLVTFACLGEGWNVSKEDRVFFRKRNSVPHDWSRNAATSDSPLSERGLREPRLQCAWAAFPQRAPNCAAPCSTLLKLLLIRRKAASAQAISAATYDRCQGFPTSAPQALQCVPCAKRRGSGRRSQESGESKYRLRHRSSGIDEGKDRPRIRGRPAGGIAETARWRKSRT